MKIRIGNKYFIVTPVSLKDRIEANKRIQKKVQPEIDRQKIIRRKAIITASKIILNK